MQDLSGRDVFSYAHKSYMEYLVSSFFASYLLQNDYDRQSLMMSNAIAEALDFRQSHLQPSPDVESFAAELISGQIEVKDRKGNILPIQENEEKYSKMIYKILMPNIIARWIPNLYGYSTLHPSQCYFTWSLVTLGILGAIYYFYLNIISNIWLDLGGVTLYMARVIIILYFNLLKDESVNIYPSTYLQICGIYIFSCNELKLPQYKINKSISALIQLGVSHLLYRSTVLHIVSLYILISGVSIRAVAGAFVDAGASPIAGAVAVAGAVVLIVFIIRLRKTLAEIQETVQQEKMASSGSEEDIGATIEIPSVE